MDIDEILLQTEEKMQKTEHFVQHEFANVRTGKASPVLVENIMVEAYGAQVRLREIAGITTPEPRVLAIQPWDVSLLQPIEKAILKANLGITPTVHGKIIKIFFPELSQERRAELVKQVRKLAEDGRIAIRNIRREAIETIKKEQKAGNISEDDALHAEKEIQKLHDQYIAKIDQHLAHKEKEIMTV
jgi:ribosome recycling factor